MCEALNFTYIALIPKINMPKTATHYRPISLCNVMYKIISKILANRLKQVQPTVISSNQRAFIPVRLITDNIMIAYEILHTMKTRLRGKEGSMEACS